MMTAWLLLLLLIVSSQSVDSQPTTEDDRVCECGGEHSIDMKEEVSELKRDVQKILLLLHNQQQLVQTMMNRLGKSLI